MKAARDRRGNKRREEITKRSFLAGHSSRFSSSSGFPVFRVFVVLFLLFQASPRFSADCWESVRLLRNVPIYSISTIVPPITFLQAFPVGPARVAGGIRIDWFGGDAEKSNF